VAMIVVTSCSWFNYVAATLCSACHSVRGVAWRLL